MKYRTRTGKVLSDQSLLSDLGQTGKGLLQSTPSSISNFFSALLQYFIGALAFLSRGVLRSNLGERTFGVLTLISIIFFVGLTLVFPSAYKVTYSWMWGDGGNMNGYLDEIYTFFLTFLYPFFIVLIGSLDKELTLAEYFKELSFVPSIPLLCFIAFTLIITLGHLAEVHNRRSQKVVVHSFYRGDSLLFKWLEGKSILGVQFSKLRIWMLLEPLFVLIVAFLFDNILNYEQVALLLTVSACCLFVEEFRVYQENRRFELDMLDGQLDAVYASELQREYQASLDEAKDESPKTFQSVFGQSGVSQRENKGSSTTFRAKIH